MGRKDWLFYSCAAVHDDVGGVALGTGGLASGVWKRWFDKTVGHAPVTKLYPWIRDARSTVSATPLSFHTHPEP